MTSLVAAWQIHRAGRALNFTKRSFLNKQLIRNVILPLAVLLLAALFKFIVPGSLTAPGQNQPQSEFRSGAEKNVAAAPTASVEKNGIYTSKDEVAAYCREILSPKKRRSRSDGTLKAAICGGSRIKRASAAIAFQTEKRSCPAQTGASGLSAISDTAEGAAEPNASCFLATG